MRVLPIKRISRDTEESSALERQGIELEEACREGGHDIVEWVEDSCVSGAVNLDKRKSLGKWLKEPLVNEWEALMVTTQDRITRDDIHWWLFVAWVLEHKKTVIVLDDPSLDLTTEDGRTIAGFKASGAAKYRKAVQVKKLNQTNYYRSQNLWPGGKWPYGYRTTLIEHNSAMREKLVLDPVSSVRVREAYDRLVNKSESLRSIANDWNAAGAHSPSDHQRHVNKKAGRSQSRTEVRGIKWTTTSLRGVLTNPAILGYAIHKGEVRKQTNGLPVVWADPILTRAEFDKLQTVLEKRKGNGRTSQKAVTPWIGVLFCKCGAPMYRHNTRNQNSGKQEYQYYVCRDRSGTYTAKACQLSKSWPVKLTDEWIASIFLEYVGDLEVIERTFVSGVDHGSEIAELKTALENLTQSIAMAKSPAVISALTASMEEHAVSIAKLEAEPVIPSGYSEIPTGVTYREQWDAKEDLMDKGEFLRKSGFRIHLGGSHKIPNIVIYVGDDLEKRVRDVSAGMVEPGWPELATATSQASVAEMRAEEAKVAAYVAAGRRAVAKAA
ncbi:recombinase family protein [Streptomyces blastmyceticus]|uniref:Recombinase family protein n=1 Tax=Streptomyces blastmyceticus TaxID=68180 RepID=A0ABN0XXW4_9ACTN